MRDLLEMYTVEYLTKFDTVMAHTFQMLRKDSGVDLPPNMDYENYNKAKDETMALHRLSIKNQIPYIDIVYQRIIEGTV